MNKKQQINDLNEIINYVKRFKERFPSSPILFKYLRIWRKCLADLRSINSVEEKQNDSDKIFAFLDGHYKFDENSSTKLKDLYEHISSEIKDIEYEELKYILGGSLMITGEERHESILGLKKK